MASIQRNHYVLAVPDAEASAKYLIDKMGFEKVSVVDPGWRFVKRDGVLFMLGSCPDAIPPRELGDHSYFAYLVVDDVDELHDEFSKSEVTIRFSPTDRSWGMREFAVETLDGHRIMIGQEITP